MLLEGSRIPVGHTHIKHHLIFDVKHVSLERKARYVAGGHMTTPPVSITYTSVASRESVCIAFVLVLANQIPPFSPSPTLNLIHARDLWRTDSTIST